MHGNKEHRDSRSGNGNGTEKLGVKTTSITQRKAEKIIPDSREVAGDCTRLYFTSYNLSKHFIQNPKVRRGIMLSRLSRRRFVNPAEQYYDDNGLGGHLGSPNPNPNTKLLSHFYI